MMDNGCISCVLYSSLRHVEGEGEISREGGGGSGEVLR